MANEDKIEVALDCLSGYIDDAQSQGKWGKEESPDWETLNNARLRLASLLETEEANSYVAKIHTVVFRALRDAKAALIDPNRGPSGNQPAIDDIEATLAYVSNTKLPSPVSIVVELYESASAYLMARHTGNDIPAAELRLTKAISEHEKLNKE